MKVEITNKEWPILVESIKVIANSLLAKGSVEKLTLQRESLKEKILIQERKIHKRDQLIAELQCKVEHQVWHDPVVESPTKAGVVWVLIVSGNGKYIARKVNAGWETQSGMVIKGSDVKGWMYLP